MPPRNDDRAAVLRVLDEQNPWHRSGEVPHLLAPPTERALARSLWSRLPAAPHRFQLILGPRRVGKTTVMYQTVRHLLNDGVDPGAIWWLRLDHPVLMQVPLGDLVTTAIEASGHTQPITLLLDELVYARDWDLWLKTFYDDHWPVRIVATSSATAALRDRRLESGVGRWEDQYLTPYLYPEFLDLALVPTALEAADDLSATIHALPTRLDPAARLEALRKAFLLVGGFPELLYNQQNDEGDLLTPLLRSQQILRSDAVERAIYKDIPQSFGVDNPLMLERLLYVLASQATGILSPTGICSELGLSQPTFDRYLSYLEKAFLVFTLPNYSGRETNVQKRGRKLYFVDGAVRNAALQRGAAPLADPTEQGKLLENLVASTLHALALHSNVRLFHWRDGKHEVDLVYDHPDHPVALEIGSSPDHHRRGLQALIDRHPRFAGNAYITTPTSAMTRSANGIGSIPLDMLLVACGKQAERAMHSRLGN